ncbi:lipoprotein [Spiroplasma endosymbiont of Sarcophaga variegata]|uniref:lipoprotein n=1 Tax=Spiroplasma endosymbiont of Sarcophaga variegata TaxID=3066304 RepID=UPI003AF83E21
MKKILSLLGTITLIGTSTTSLVACNTSQYTEQQLKELKEKHKIYTENKEIKDNLEWIAPQDKPFSKVDNKYYFVVWHIKNNDDWRIIKFKNNIAIGYYQKIILDKYNTYDLKITEKNLLADENRFAHHFWWDSDDGSHIKAVYRWNNDSEPNTDVEDKLKSYLDL